MRGLTFHTINRKQSGWKKERCNKLFLNLQQRNNSKKNIQRLRKNDGNMLTTPEEIMNEIEKYYTEMFSAEDQEECREDLFFPYNHVKLTDDQKQSCEGLITEDELYLSIMCLKKGKTPGLSQLKCIKYFMNM